MNRKQIKNIVPPYGLQNCSRNPPTFSSPPLSHGNGSMHEINLGL
ncbi:hypothetical protein TorRG33x02_055220 [Trema orientale]|uniref:Uncharacterized protein n=1 Tax=Trema orientale TaxID=63057 RepID=A0A2P5FLD9_TREOI|nr:hypothetical protein TorRG33x02_055220 [Trema orientale]